MSQSCLEKFFANTPAPSKQNREDSNTLLEESMGATQMDEHATKGQSHGLVDVDSDAETDTGMIGDEELPKGDKELLKKDGGEGEPEERGDEEEPKEEDDEEAPKEERGSKKRKHHDEGKGRGRKTAKAKSMPKPEPKAKGNAKKAAKQKEEAKKAKEEEQGSLLEAERQTMMDDAIDKPKPRQHEANDLESLGIKALLNDNFESFIKEQLGTEFQEKNVDCFQRWFAARAEAKKEKAEESSTPTSDLGFFEKKEYERLQAALATGKIESKSYLGNSYRKHLLKNPQEAESYHAASRAEQAQFRLRWAKASFGKFEEGKKHECAWSRVDTTRGCYMNLARLVAHLGGWASAEARSGALCAAQKCAAMGSPWMRVNDQTSLCEFLIMETSWSETFRNSWRQRSWTTGDLKGDDPTKRSEPEKAAGSEGKGKDESKGTDTKGKTIEKKGKGSLPKGKGDEAQGEATGKAKGKDSEAKGKDSETKGKYSETKGKDSETKGQDNETKGQGEEGKAEGKPEGKPKAKPKPKGNEQEPKGDGAEDSSRKRQRQGEILDHNLLWKQAEKLKVQYQQSSSNFLAIRSKIAEDGTWAWARGHSADLEGAHREITNRSTEWIRNFLMSDSASFRKANSGSKAGLELQVFVREGKPAIDALASWCSRLTRAHSSLHP